MSSSSNSFFQKNGQIEDLSSTVNQNTPTADVQSSAQQNIEPNVEKDPITVEPIAKISFWKLTCFRIIIGVVIVLLIALGIFLGCYYGIISKRVELLSVEKQANTDTKNTLGNSTNSLEKNQTLIDDEADKNIFYHVQLNTTTALCLDGSPGSYYISKTGDPSKILIYFSGGAWCKGQDNQTLLENCYQRSKTDLGSSNNFWLIYSLFKGIISDYKDNYFRDWKRVFFTYCDGAGHQGYRKDPIQYKEAQLYFRGHNLTIQRFQDLEKRFGLFSKENQVILTGESAGGLAVYTWANYLKERIQKGKLWAVPDAGIFYDAKNKDTQRHSYKENFANLMQFSNQEVDFPASQCVQAFPDAKENCFLAQNLIKFMKVPYFVIQSLYDTWALPQNYGVRCIYDKDLSNCTNQEINLIEENRKNVLGVLSEVVKDKKNGAFALSCRIHGNLNQNLAFNENFTVPQLSEFTSAKAIADWMENPDGNNIHLDQETWPNNHPCAASITG